jgi:shikimate dehydrogenase
LLLGAGGACRAIYFSLASIGVTHIDIANRTASRAEELIAACPHSVHSRALTSKEVINMQSEYDIIINTTTVGMYPNVKETPLVIQDLKKDAIVSDIIYNPLQTTLLKNAEYAGALTQNGIDMFVYQGAMAFELWTKKWPDIERMKQLVIQKLGG